MTPAISVVVPTRNRAAALATLVEALIGQDASGIAFEVLIVDNGSTDRTADVVARAAAGDPRVRFIREPNRGASHARNAGIVRAAAPIVAFVDDDVVPARDWIRAIHRTFDAHPEVDCVGGRVEPRWAAPPPDWLDAQHCAPLALQVDRPPRFDADHASACLITANFACRRRVFDEVGGFSTAFQRDEDREFNLRLWRAGKRGLYADDVRVVAPIEPQRLTKRYHRRWYETTGANHARLRYREIIDRDGRLVPPPAGRRVLGTPAFVYRECMEELGHWFRHLVRGRMSEAFRCECRVRYFLSYIAARARLLLMREAA